MKKPIYHEVIINTCTGTHLTIDEIFFSLKKIYPKIGIATVYRNVKQLTQSGKLTKLSLGKSGGDFYEATHKEHAHIINQSTHSIDDIIIPEHIIKEIHKLTGKTVKKLELNVYV